ncbi:hypothetical protein AB0I00_29785 [Streptomyces sp. NPDC050803]|uniref:hypothetical protein n=1 Tax=unclassified Streptomyces TaxID=2593676 RepID=UPI00341C2ACB
MFMRLCPPTPVSLPLAAAAALLLAPPAAQAAVPPATHAAAPAPPTATCATPTNPTNPTFPLTTRLHSGPKTYEAGGGYGTWYLDLTNTTTQTCRNVHPVVVLVDERHALRPAQPRLEYYAGDTPQPHPVRFETTDADELVGALAHGLTVGPRETLTVKLRLAVTSDAVPNRVTANAAVVQRHDDDGDWIGQSNDYRFDIDADEDPDTATDSTTDPTTPPFPLPDELARTGTPVTALVTALALLLTTTGTLLLARRRR